MREVTGIFVYSFDELTDEAKLKAISDQIEFEVEIMDENSPYCYCAEDMEKMGTPWFLGQYIYEKEKESIIETIKLNEYEFFDDGEIIPAKYQKI